MTKDVEKVRSTQNTRFSRCGAGHQVGWHLPRTGLNQAKETLTVGDTFKNIKNTMIINRSQIQGAVNTLQDSNQGDAARALQAVSDAVEESGSAKAGQYMDGFVEELEKPEPRKPILESMWNGILSIVGVVPKVVEATESIERLIESQI